MTSPPTGVEIAPLVDRPHLIHEIAEEAWQEWGYSSPDRCADDLSRTARDELPVCEVAVVDDAAVGVVSLIECNLPPRCELSPWLAGLYVWPAHRRRGIGAALVRALEADAARLGYLRLFLYTESAEEFYARLGWRTIDRDRWEGEAIAIMSTDLVA